MLLPGGRNDGCDEVVKLIRAVRSRSARGLPTSTADGLPLYGANSGTSGEPTLDDGPSQDVKE